MNWLSELKVNLQSGFHVDEETVDIKRLIAIAEGAELVECIWDGVDSYVEGCPLCYVEADMQYDRGTQAFVLVNPIEHEKHCPYSEDWG